MCILLLLLLAGWELLGSLPCCLAIANDNPEIEGTSNAAKDPGLGKRDDPTTQSHASYLKTLSEQAQDPSAFEEKLTKAEASKRIDALKARLGLSAQS